MHDTLLFTRDDSGIATITFNRPHVKNALAPETMAAFADAVQTLASDDSLRVVIVTGAGGEAFCSGGDLKRLHTLATASEGAAMAAQMTDALAGLEALPVPVIAAINGYALGGGSEIALACDLRIADEAARLGMVHLRLALIPGWGAGGRLARLVGYGRAMQMMLSARPYSAEELHTLGVINQVRPVGEALAAARAFAEELTTRDAAAVRAIKTLLRAAVTLPPAQAQQIEQDLFPPLWEGEAHQRAVERFLHKQQK